MNTIQKEINLNVRHPHNYQMIHAMQGDNNTIEITATIFDGNDKYTIDCEKIEIDCISPTGIKNALNVKSHTAHTVTFTLDKNVLKENGKHKLSVHFMSSPDISLTTFPSILFVCNAPLGSLSKSEFVTITEYVFAAQKSAEEAKASSEASEQSASKAQKSADDAAASAALSGTKASEASASAREAGVSAQTASQKATESSNSAENAATCADTASAYADTAGAYSQAASQHANEAAESAKTAAQSAASAAQSETNACGSADRANEEAEKAKSYAEDAKSYMDSAITGVESGDNCISASQTGSVITITHEDVTRANTTSSTSLSHGDAFTVVKSVASDEKGHVTSVHTETVTLPATTVLSNTASSTVGAIWYE